MTSAEQAHRSGQPPAPDGFGSLDDLVVQLRALRAWAGVSERELHRRVVRRRKAQHIPEVPSYDTVHRCFQLGRARLNIDLVADIVSALQGDETAVSQWRAAHAAIAREAAEAAIVVVFDALPDELGGFAGRDAAVKQICESVVSGEPGAARTAVVEGMAGVGKTELALHVAHRLTQRGEFDSVLSVNLRAFAADLAPVSAAAALEGFLRRLGDPPDRVRVLDLPGRVRRFRAHLAEKRVLVLLDDAVDERQLRPLLPDSPTCAALVTSRRRLVELTEASRLHLDVFAPDEARQCLRGAVGDRRVDADPQAADRIAATVGYMPLALQAAAERIKTSPGWTLADHLERLEDRREQLKLDERVERSFRLSYNRLSPSVRGLLRMLSLHPDPDFDTHAAAALAGVDLDTAEAGVAALQEANLLRESSPGRHAFHDLMRRYVRSLAHDQDPAHARRAALTRLDEHVAVWR